MDDAAGIEIRHEQKCDEHSIRRLLQVAFGGSEEADLLDALRRRGDLALSLVAIQDAQIVGHVAMSYLSAPARALALAPLAVEPTHQGKGVGSALVARSLYEARRQSVAIVFVLGEADYYARFGFSATVARSFPSAYSGPHFMALWTGEDRVPAGPVIYSDAFESLGA